MSSQNDSIPQEEKEEEDANKINVSVCCSNGIDTDAQQHDNNNNLPAEELEVICQDARRSVLFGCDEDDENNQSSTSDSAALMATEQQQRRLQQEH